MHVNVKKYKRIAELVVAALLLTGLVLAAAVTFVLPNYLAVLRDEWIAELDTVNVDDGVDAAEAATILQIYTGEFITGCGGAAPPSLINGEWVSRIHIGYGGQLSNQLARVNATTGRVSSTEGPTFPRLLLLKTSISWGMAWRRMNWIEELPYDLGLKSYTTTTKAGNRLRGLAISGHDRPFTKAVVS